MTTHAYNLEAFKTAVVGLIENRDPRAGKPSDLWYLAYFSSMYSADVCAGDWIYWQIMIRARASRAGALLV